MYTMGISGTIGLKAKVRCSIQNLGSFGAKTGEDFIPNRERRFPLIRGLTHIQVSNFLFRLGSAQQCKHTGFRFQARREKLATQVCHLAWLAIARFWHADTFRGPSRQPLWARPETHTTLSNAIRLYKTHASYSYYKFIVVL